MFRSLFGRSKRRRDRSSSGPRDDSIRSARAGDVVTISGLGLEYEDSYFFIERRHRYTTGPDSWYELECADGDTRVWVEWTDGYNLSVSATGNPDPSGLDSIGLTEDDLIELDEQHSIDNFINVGGQDYRYRNSAEVSFYKDCSGPGEPFYHWDFLSDDGLRILSITKWEGRPFEVVFSEVLSPDSVTLYQGDRPESGPGRGR